MGHECNNGAAGVPAPKGIRIESVEHLRQVMRVTSRFYIKLNDDDARSLKTVYLDDDGLYTVVHHAIGQRDERMTEAKLRDTTSIIKAVEQGLFYALPLRKVSHGKM